MKFEEWFSDEYGDEIDFRILHILKEDTRKSWDYQQEKIDDLKTQLKIEKETISNIRCIMEACGIGYFDDNESLMKIHDILIEYYNNKEKQ